MKKILKLIISSAVFISISAYANIFEYSYTFSNNHVIHGTFTGNMSGEFVNNIDNVQAYFDGNYAYDRYGRPYFVDSTISNWVGGRGLKLDVFGWNPAEQLFDINVLPDVSPNLFLSNFKFGCKCGDDFYVRNEGVLSGLHEVSVFDDSATIGGAIDSNSVPERWKLVDIPEPNVLYLFFIGLALLIFQSGNGVIARKNGS